MRSVGPVAGEVPGKPYEGQGIDVRAQPNGVQRNAARSQLAREVPRPRLVLVQHQKPDAPAPLAQLGKQGEQMGLGARDPGHLLHVQDADVAHDCAA